METCLTCVYHTDLIYLHCTMLCTHVFHLDYSEYLIANTCLEFRPWIASPLTHVPQPTDSWSWTISYWKITCTAPNYTHCIHTLHHSFPTPSHRYSSGGKFWKAGTIEQSQKRRILEQVDWEFWEINEVMGTGIEFFQQDLKMYLHTLWTCMSSPFQEKPIPGDGGISVHRFSLKNW